MFGVKKHKKTNEIFPDEILLDSTNMPNFDTVRFEGKIEKPLGKNVFWGVLVFFLLIVFIYAGRIFSLQIMQGEYFKERSTNNSFKLSLLLPERGIIYDRKNNEIAWNGAEFDIVAEDENGKEIVLDSTTDWKTATDRQKQFQDEGVYGYVSINPSTVRTYSNKPGLSHILGYIGRPSEKDLGTNKIKLLEQFVGKEGLEKFYNSALQGVTGLRLLEKDSKGSIISENTQTDPEPGKKITLAIDSNLQSQMFSIIKAAADTYGYQGGAGVIIDTDTGEVLSIVSYPEYDSNILSQGQPADKIKGFFQNKNKPFLNRAVGGLYAPGSIIKPAIALAALNEGVITPEKQILSTGSISIQNPYDPNLKSVFKDWKAHGWVDMRHALAVSSDVYFYEVGGGYENQKGLGIKKLDDYVKMFGFGEKTGIDLLGEEDGTVPSPETKAKTEPKDPTWRVGDTYNASIGQGSFHITPIEMARYAAALANGGKVLQPHIIKDTPTDIIRTIDIPQQYFKVVQEGMRMCAVEGTAIALNTPYVKIAAKTGTAELGAAKKYTNSWTIGYFPYDKPRYAFALVMERGIHKEAISAAATMRQVTDWMSVNTPEYFTSQ